ncbi:TPA: hypothetical protein LUX64_004453, partial [Enterobacter hormaechei]|nr:hypothetical protein [Enterobacter hormaechei]
MLNFIVASEAYDFFKEKNGTETFPVSRLFESTSEELRNKLIPIEEGTLEFLSLLPTIFITEPESESLDGPEKSLVRMGYISNVKLKITGREPVVSFDFSVDHDFGTCELKSSNKYVEELGLGSFGLHRTHWSVKEKSLGQVLRPLGLEKKLFKVQPATTDHSK